MPFIDPDDQYDQLEATENEPASAFIDPDEEPAAAFVDPDDIPTTRMGARGTRPVSPAASGEGDTFQANFAKAYNENIHSDLRRVMTAVNPFFGAEIAHTDPITGKFEWFSTVEDRIPGFNEMSYKERVKALGAYEDVAMNVTYGDDFKDTGAEARAGQVAGFLADPTMLVPMVGFGGKVVKGAQLAKNMGKGGAAMAGVGAGFQNLHDLGTTGEWSNPVDTALAATGGFLLGAGGTWAGNKIRQKAADAVAKRDKEDFGNFMTSFNTQINKLANEPGASPMSAYNVAKDIAGVDDDFIRLAADKSGIKPHIGKDWKPGMETLSARAQRTTADFGRVLTPLREQAAKLSPTVGKLMAQWDQEQHAMQHLMMTEAEDWLGRMDRLWNGSGRATVNNITHLLNNNDRKAAFAVMKRIDPDLARAFVPVNRMLRRNKATIQDLYKHSFDKGSIKSIRDYFPRSVIPEKLAVHQEGIYHQELAKIAKKKGTSIDRLAPEDYETAFRRAASTTTTKTKTTPGAYRGRKINVVTKEMIEDGAYEPAHVALGKFIHMLSDDHAMRSFQRNLGYKGDFDVFGSDVASSLAKAFGDMAKRGELDRRAQQKLIELVRARYQAREVPSAGFQIAKNLMHSIGLGSPGSAAIQLGDIPVAIVRNKRMLSGLKKVRPKNKADFHLKRLHTGLTEASEDMLTDSAIGKADSSAVLKTRKWTNHVLRGVGFKRVDDAAKGFSMNSGAKARMKQIQTNRGYARFAAEWQNVMGERFPNLVRDLRNPAAFNARIKAVNDAHKKVWGSQQATKMKKKASAADRAALRQAWRDLYKNHPEMMQMIWTDLADIQPIGKADMPRWYLENPNWRIGYTMMTFFLKQLNFGIKQGVVDQLKRGNHVQAAKNFAVYAALMGGGNTAIEYTRDMLRGKEVDLDPASVGVDVLLNTINISRYTGEQLANFETMFEALWDMILPPTSILSGVTTRPETALPTVGAALGGALGPAGSTAGAAAGGVAREVISRIRNAE